MQNSRIESKFISLFDDETLAQIKDTGLVSDKCKRNWVIVIRMKELIVELKTLALVIERIKKDYHLDLSLRQIRNIYDDNCRKFHAPED